ncbi:MAG: cyclase family protein [Armatimonadetes bacterium]|nr:cyclase family protein [Armatimonadota bacterium]
MIHDLSVPITNGTDWYREAGTIPVSLQRVGSYEEGWVSHQVALMVLNGTTYLETGAHLYPDMSTLDEMPPEKFIARAFVVDVGCPAIRSGSQIICSLPAPRANLKGFRPDEDAILLACGWDRHVDADDYYHASPYFSPELQQWLLDHRPAILGGDMLSYDHPDDTAMPFLRTFFRGGGMILCPLIGLDALPPTVTLYCAPLKLVGSNAAPCRALAVT